MDSDTEIIVTGKAYDVSYQSLRPIFSATISYQKISDKIIAKRVWSGIGSEPVAQETLVWSEQSGLLSAGMCQHYLHEEAEIEKNANELRFLLSSHRTEYNHKILIKYVEKIVVTLLSMPLEIVKHWEQLIAGEPFDCSYAVMKVQNHTAVSVKMESDSLQSVVSVTPRNPVWRYIFGSMKFVFEKNRPLLKEIHGLIEPRDHKKNGKYKEYVGTLMLDTPLDIGQIITPITEHTREN